ncbi:MAG: hypothetical protein ACK55I_42320, partial [bacterium]
HEIRIDAFLATGGAQHLRQSRERAIGACDPDESPFDDDRRDRLDHRLAVVDVRLGDAGLRLAGHPPRLAHAPVVEACLHVDVRLVGQAIARAPVEERVGNEAPAAIRLRARDRIGEIVGVEAVCVGLIDEIRADRPRILRKELGQQLHEPLALADAWLPRNRAHRCDGLHQLARESVLGIDLSDEPRRHPAKLRLRIAHSLGIVGIDLQRHGDCDQHQRRHHAEQRQSPDQPMPKWKPFCAHARPRSRGNRWLARDCNGMTVHG